MSAVGTIRRLHEHRRWVNQRLLSAAARLSEEQLRQQFSIGQGSVWKTLTHLLAAEFVWLEALQGNESPVMRGDVEGRLPGNQQANNAFATLSELKEFWGALEARWIDYLDRLPDAALAETVYKVSTSSAFGQRRGVRRADILLHVCTHAQYTTAQLINMLRQLGQTDLPDVMIITLAREDEGSSDGSTPS